LSDRLPPEQNVPHLVLLRVAAGTSHHVVPVRVPLADLLPRQTRLLARLRAWLGAFGRTRR
jgi:hypothetical protein